jgi:hypothetical protein
MGQEPGPALHVQRKGDYATHANTWNLEFNVAENWMDGFSLHQK